MSLRDFLERFRPAGTPGASAAGVPVDRTAERASELEPTLAQLMDVQREAARIRASADEKTAALVEAALAVIDRCLELVSSGAPADAVEAVDFTPLLRARESAGPTGTAPVAAARNTVLARLKEVA
ncbi:hypothetical protein GCM10009647_071660 [Streptomyces sanglieri]|uniref:Uncharacterized protein n=1 Tax=Streptomyces sanglieri TaxID=193460 RepID=A0ABW2WNY4_9ACTN|nr:hypothetical protein [Streptomyces sp. Wh19]MDV9195153.1 hypothetical protein [Streptomyces sp. Wh19]